MATILTYHQIAVSPEGDKKKGLYVSPRQLESHLAHLKEKRVPVVSLDEVRSNLLSEGDDKTGSVVITFDDGYLNNFEEALPLLEKNQFRATFFITTGWIGREGTMGSMMTREQIAQAQDLARGWRPKDAAQPAQR